MKSISSLILLPVLLQLLFTALWAVGQDLEPLIEDGEVKIPEVGENHNLTGYTLTVEVFSVPMALAAEMKRLQKTDDVTYVELPQFKIQRIEVPVVLPFHEVVLVGALSDPSPNPARDGNVWMVFATVSRIAAPQN